MPATNHQFRLAARPVGLPKDSDWQRTEEPVRDPADGQVLVKILYISLDPAMRGWMTDARSYIAPVGLGDVMRAGTAGRVIASKNARFAVGDHVVGMLGVQEYALSDGKGLFVVDASRVPLRVYMSALGMTGMTAYFGMHDIGKPRPSETVVVSGAAGAVGMVAGQIGKIMGCRVVGIAGGSAKCAYLVDELGFDAAIDYKAEDVHAALGRHCPKGIDVFFDNVGGDILDAALARLALHARVVFCGAISQYNSTSGVKGPANYRSLLVNRASMTGMIIFDYADRYAEAARALGGWMAAGKLKSREDIVEGFDKFPQTLLMLFRGENTGKLLLKVTEY